MERQRSGGVGGAPAHHWRMIDRLTCCKHIFTATVRSWFPLGAVSFICLRPRRPNNFSLHRATGVEGEGCFPVANMCFAQDICIYSFWGERRGLWKWFLVHCTFFFPLLFFSFTALNLFGTVKTSWNILKITASRKLYPSKYVFYRELKYSLNFEFVLSGLEEISISGLTILTLSHFKWKYSLYSKFLFEEKMDKINIRFNCFKKLKYPQISNFEIQREFYIYICFFGIGSIKISFQNWQVEHRSCAEYIRTTFDSPCK